MLESENRIIKKRLEYESDSYRFEQHSLKRIIKTLKNSTSISIREIFLKYDKHMGGIISKLEFEDVLKTLGIKFSTSEFDNF